MANLINRQLKKYIKLRDTKIWHLYIACLSNKNLTIFKNFSSKIDFKKIILNKLYKDYQKKKKIR